MDVKLISFSVGPTDIFIMFFDGSFLQLTGFYRNPNILLRDDFLELLRKLQRTSNVLRFVCSDFNKIVSLDKKLGGATRSEWQISKF